MFTFHLFLLSWAVQKRLSDLIVLSTVVWLYHKNESAKMVVKTTSAQANFVITAYKFSKGGGRECTFTLSELQDKMDFTLKAT